VKRTLPVLPSLSQQRHLAKDLFKAWKASSPEALQRFRASHPRLRSFRDAEIAAQDLKLADAQLVIAREYGWESWQKLRRHIESLTGGDENEKVLTLARAVAAGQHAEVRRILKRAPDLARVDIASSNEHRALHFAVRNRDAEMVRILMEAGADAGQGVYPRRESTSPRAIADDRGYCEIVAIFDEADEKKRQEARCPNLTVTPDILDLSAVIKRGGDATVMERVRKDPALLESCDLNGETVVHHAARWGRLELLKELIEAGAHVNKMNVDGLRALDLAVLMPGSGEAKDGCQRVSELLLKQKDIILSVPTAVALGEVAWVRKKAKSEPKLFAHDTHRKCGLLQIAIHHNQLAMLELLLELGCDPNDKNRLKGLETATYDSGEPLWIAAGESKYDFARSLLDRGADPNAEHYASGAPLHRAYNNRDQKMVDLLIKRGARPDAVMAAYEGDNERAIDGLKQDPKLFDKILMGGVDGGSPDLVRHCLQQAKLPPDDESWYSLLWSAMVFWRCLPFRKFRDCDHENYFQIFSLLLSAGANPNAKGPWNITPLHQTVFVGHYHGQYVSTPDERVRFATLLLDAGAKLDIKDDELLSTPLGWAARQGQIELAKLFLERGASTNLPDDEPWATPLAWATRKGHQAVAELLRNHGAMR
jgi:ankyrin repeat protein